MRSCVGGRANQSISKLCGQNGLNQNKREKIIPMNTYIVKDFFNRGLILIFMYNSTVCLFITGLYIFVWKYSSFVYYRTVLYFMKLFLKKYRIFWKILNKTSWVFFSFWMLLNMLNIFSDFIIFIYFFYNFAQYPRGCTR